MEKTDDIVSSPSIDPNDRSSTELEKDDSEILLIQPFNVIPIPDSEFLHESIANCNKPICDDADLECILNMVNGTICEARAVIQSDPRGLFCYKCPKEYSHLGSKKSRHTFESPLERSEYSEASETIRHWLTIGDFEYSNMIPLVRDFIAKWQLSPETKCVVLTNTKRHDVPLKGSIYFIDAHFSRPTPRCPNPLAVAKVRFIVTVSSVLRDHYPVMVTYRFEGYRTLYYALGCRAINSRTFQRFYIDTILHTKLSFFAEICESRHGTIAAPKAMPNPKSMQ
ncbi:uncharacterized protein LOC117568806 [Drosophila albomicans]|uniref:Uncharacterized protein LOC117568806 n=1 Tax=Drosophila albomicans TaxID=7291 RepID=A0A6P8X1F9_DROAB|nr:uncharacterized protein LOC117568806 [Drosophila albomicans]